MSRNVLTRYLKKHMLEVNQDFFCVGDLLKRTVFGDKIEPLKFQRVELESEQPGVTWLVYFITPSRMGKC
jgi:hypothetical protein